jgi:hypothetical protein
MASTLKVDRIETPSGVGNISFAQPISGDGSQLTGVGLNIANVVAGDIIYYDGSNYVRLPKGTAAEVLKMNAGATAPEWGTDAGGMAVPASSAAGDILYYDGSNYVRLAKGTAGQQLAINSGATAPEWITASSGGGGGWTTIGTDVTVSSSVNSISYSSLSLSSYRVVRIEFFDLAKNNNHNTFLKTSNDGFTTEDTWPLNVTTTHDNTTTSYDRQANCTRGGGAGNYLVLTPHAVWASPIKISGYIDFIVNGAKVVVNGLGVALDDGAGAVQWSGFIDVTTFTDLKLENYSSGTFDSGSVRLCGMA